MQDPKPGARRPASKTTAGRADAGGRRPLARAGDWTRERWAATRARLGRAGRPSRRTVYVAAGVASTLVIGVAVLIAVWDWNWFRGPVAGMASARMHRQVSIDGDLRVHLLSWQPSATVDRVRIANPAWAGEGDMAEIQRIAVQIRLMPLFVGRLDMQLLEFDRPSVRLHRDLKGRATWDFSDGRKTDQPLKLPPIRRFIIRDGQLQVHDEKRKLTFSGAVNAREKLGAAIHGFEMTGAGALNAQPFHLEVTGGPLLNIERDRPYPFDADIRAGQTFVTARGAVPKPFDLGQFYMNVTARGPDLADLYGLTGVPLPNSPPYSLHGRLSRELHVYRITGLGGRVGSSDLTGELSVDGAGERPLLKANLRSASLDFPDLGALFGGAPKAGKVASPAQVAVARTLQAQQRIFPDSTLRVERIRAIDADVTYKAASIRNAPIHLKSGSVRVRLDNGLLKADPLDLELPQGHMAGSVALNARGATPVTDIDLRLSNGRLEHLIPVQIRGVTPFTGAVVARARLRGTGNSVHKAFASANGEVMVAVPGGQINEAFAELLGINLTKGLGLLFSESRDRVPIRCGVAHFQTSKGVMTADHIVFDTEPVLVTGSGSIDLGSERMNFRVQGHPKEFRLVRLRAPLTVNGPLLHPKLGLQAGGAIAQGGIAAVLASVVSPLALVLPFIDPGLAKDASCGALIADAGREGAPIKSAPAVKAR
ncbi:MAG: AsmA family protein [Phenylobacterium sp.]